RLITVYLSFSSLLTPPSAPFSLSFFSHAPATSEIYTLSLHDALPIFLEESVLPAFRAESGVEVEATYEPTKVLSALIADGARPDVMLGVGSALEQLATDGILDADTISPLVRSGIGVAVPPAATRPGIATVEELIEA